MSRHKHHKRSIVANQQQRPPQGQEITPGRAPAEGPEMVEMAPTHEWWEHHTDELDPVEGADMEPSEGSTKREP